MRSFLIIVSCFLFTAPVFAAVSTSGDVSPTPNVNGGNVSGNLSVGDGENNGDTTIGLMLIDDGTLLVSSDGTVGNRLGSNGSVVIGGLGSEWTATDDMFIGNDGYGDVLVAEQGRISSGDDFSIGALNDGRGWLTIDGRGSIMEASDVLTVGLAGTGTLEASTTARVVSGTGVVGSDAGSSGFARVQSQASWRIRSNLTVGASGVGVLAIDDGGFVENANGIITSAAAGGGSVSVTGQNSVWLNRGDLTVGSSAAGELSIEDGGLVQVQDVATIRRDGRIVMSDGRLTARSISNSGVIGGSGRVDGPVTNLETGSIRADSSEATLLFTSAITNQGSIDAIEGALEFQNGVTNAATAAGIFARDGQLRFRRGLTNNGTMGFTVGAADVFGNVNNASTGTIEVDGEGVVTFYDDVASSGTLTIGPESSAVFLGDFSIASSASVVLTGLAADPFPNDLPSIIDPVNVAGQLELNGSLSVDPSADLEAVTEPFEPGTEVTLSLATANQLLGNFAEVSYDSTVLSMDFMDADGRSFRSYDAANERLGLFRLVNYTDSEVDITNYWAIPGDTDGDRDVDFIDFLTVAENFGMEGDWLDGDFSGDGLVLFNDFLDLANNFGTVVASANLQSVPEPSGLAIAWCLGILMLGARCRRSAR